MCVRPPHILRVLVTSEYVSQLRDGQGGLSEFATAWRNSPSGVLSEPVGMMRLALVPHPKASAATILDRGGP